MVRSGTLSWIAVDHCDWIACIRRNADGADVDSGTLADCVAYIGCVAAGNFYRPRNSVRNSDGRQIDGCTLCHRPHRTLVDRLGKTFDL